MGEENNTLSPDFVKLFLQLTAGKRQGHPGWQRNRGQHPIQGHKKKARVLRRGPLLTLVGLDRIELTGKFFILGARS